VVRANGTVKPSEKPMMTLRMMESYCPMVLLDMRSHHGSTTARCGVLRHPLLGLVRRHLTWLFNQLATRSLV
jgi:hypothetical protein